MALRVTLAGRVALETENGRVDAEGLGRLGRLAFAYLVAERRRPVPRDELAEVLWRDTLPRSWETSLRVVLSKLRGWVAGAGLDGASTLTSAFGCYQLHLPPTAAIDVEEAGVALDTARAALAEGDPATARAQAESAAAVAALPFLPGGSEPWVERRQAELSQLRVQALEVLADAALAGNDPDGALGAAEEAVSLEPMRESAYLRVMKAQAATGNRAAALRTYERCRQMLVEELGVSPSAAAEAVYLALLREDGQTLAPAPQVSPSWPPPPAPVSSFVGRTGEVAEIAGLVRSSRVVTLLGTGGVGKTRLSLQVAAAVAAEFPGGTPFVHLGDLTDPARLPAFAAAALGLGEEAGQSALDTIATAVAAAGPVLLVIDNCEHVVAAAARLADDLLQRCPGLTVLATSREPLAVAGEAAWRVPSLSVPEAVRLFVERARAADRAFEPGDDPAIEAVVTRLDGIPLAIELAAARVPVLSVAEIAARLEDRFALLTGGARTAPARHQTLRAAVDWTYEALGQAERRLLHHLAVFPGSFTLAAAERLTGTDVLDVLHSLVRRSLVLAEPARRPPTAFGPRRPATAFGPRRPATPGGTRFRMLETIRAYAAEKLDESGQGPSARRRLVDWALEAAAEAEGRLDGPDQAEWLHRLDAERPNLWAALAVPPTGPDDDRPLRLATSLSRFWEVRGYYEEGRMVLRRLLGDAGPETSPGLRARAHYAAGVLAQRQGDYAAARSRYEESLGIRRQLGDAYGAAVALHGLASLAALERDLETARALYQDTVAAGRQLGDPDLVAAALTNLGWVAHSGGDFQAARRWYEEALAVRRELGDQHGIALVLGHLGDLAYQRGEYDLAASAHGESLELRTALGDRSGRADSLATLGHLALREGDLASARSRLEESLALRREVGDRAALPNALCNLADLALVAGRHGDARRALEEAEAVAGDIRDRSALAHVLLHAARQDRAEGEVAQAAKRYRQAREAAGRPGADPLTAEWLEGVGATVAAVGDARGGARLLGAAAALRRTIGAAVPPHEEVGLDRDLATVRTALGSGFEDAVAEGEKLNLETALAEAAAALRRI